ncbi:hypothetical protein [Amycolatopsis nalaikhensis]|uniref:Uncharacterized protein n=1 Tax=Amycolatopsis nalaikhensis TaxID=715472 RepID=A0ABY8XPW2_9PSEU|nr:hypothetical protein [Amycolatopsis sp. 2-2]WIV57638.1 hypothetical protein QP939_02815 [Amycolatopsis sp. 2-2]
MYLRIVSPSPETNAQPWVIATPPAWVAAIATVPTCLPVFASMPIRWASCPAR